MRMRKCHDHLCRHLESVKAVPDTAFLARIPVMYKVHEIVRPMAIDGLQGREANKKSGEGCIRLTITLILTLTLIVRRIRHLERVASPEFATPSKRWRVKRGQSWPR